MSVKLLDGVVQSEARARRYLRSVCWNNYQRFCPRCSYRELYRLSSGRSRCKRCRYTFSEFCGRWLNQSRLSCCDWVILVRLFERERSVEEIARVLGRAYATVFHAVMVLRAGIMAHSNTCSVLLHNNPVILQRLCNHRGHKTLRLGDHVPVFGIREDDGKASVPVLPDVSPDFVLNLLVKKVRRGNIVYTGQVALYDSLIFSMVNGACGTQEVRFARSPVYIDGTSGFWEYASPRLAAHYGISADHFPLYLKELEFRYNHRDKELAPMLLQYLCDFVPRSHH